MGSEISQIRNPNCALTRVSIDFEHPLRSPLNTHLSKIYPATISDDGKPMAAVAKVCDVAAPTKRDLDKMFGPTKPSREVMEKISQEEARDREEMLTKMKDCVEIHRSLHDHPSIIKVYGLQVENWKLVLFLEKGICSLRDLMGDALSKHDLRSKVLQTTSPAAVVLQLVRGLAYIHSNTDSLNNKISHRKIRPEKIIVVFHERDNSYSFKYTDFDRAKRLHRSQCVLVTNTMWNDLYWPYNNPNLQATAKEGSTTVDTYLTWDIFALGIILHEWLTDGGHPFEGGNEKRTESNIRHLDRTSLFQSKVDEVHKNHIWAMTSLNQPSAEQVLHSLQRQEPKHQIHVINALNEVYISLDDSPTSKKKKEAFNESFFMVFEKKWQEFPCILPEILKNSKYGNQLEDLLRYLRNFIVHAGQHTKALVKHFGRELSAEDILNLLQKDFPTVPLHFVWFAKRHFPELAFTEFYPEQCALAYDEYVAMKRETMSPSSLYSRICADTATPLPDSEATNLAAKAFKEYHQELLQATRKTDVDFKALRSGVKAAKEKRKVLLRKRAKMVEHGRPDIDVAKVEAELAAADEKFSSQWMLEFRDAIREPLRFQRMYCKARDWESVEQILGMEVAPDLLNDPLVLRESK